MPLLVAENKLILNHSQKRSEDYLDRFLSDKLSRVMALKKTPTQGSLYWLPVLAFSLQKVFVKFNRFKTACQRSLGFVHSFLSGGRLNSTQHIAGPAGLISRG